jgi:type I thyroxine 5'-deiodinase
LKIYIREAHPVDGWWLGSGLLGLFVKASRSRAARDVYDPISLNERRSVAAECADALAYGIPTYVDDLDDSVNRAYAAWPTRLYLVDQEGRVAYAGGPGPYGFKPAELGRAIQILLGH